VQASGPVLGEPRRLFSTSAFQMNAFNRGYQPEPGGKSFLFFRPSASTDPTQFVLVLNWSEELKAKAKDGGSAP
jgi:hypothetical protein